ncbi:beta-propeller domain-containing protein [Alteromonadaceae bacterium BrNp21-10]|nr:beta-propeller domain-containing protein [Alteromonadaceae bacterium BrNp21-10]
MKQHIVYIAMASALLSACGGDNSSSNPPVVIQPVITAAPVINAAKAFSGSLTKGSDDNFARYLKNGVYASTVHQDPTMMPTWEFSADASSAQRSYSTTNTQEVGVDEADRIEYNGDTLFIAAYPDWQRGEEAPYIRVMSRQQDFSLTESARLPLSSSGNINGLYLQQDRLAAVSSSYPMMTIDVMFFAPGQSFDSKIGVAIYDVANVAEPATVDELQVDGWLLSSRRIDNYLYLVSSYTASMPELAYAGEDKDQQLTNYLSVNKASTADLMPKLYRNGIAENLNQPEDCYYPAEATEADGYAALLTVVKIDLDNPSDVQSLCMSVNADTMYMSEQAMYLTSSVDNSTVLHKVSFDPQLDYQASGQVKGIINWRGYGHLRLSEHNDVLRVVTSDYQQRDPDHRLFMLSQQNNELVTVASLPNEAQPQALGKEGEDIYAVRFFDDKGYIVTFERIDPLYVLDLADPQHPFVAGSLEVPGFSNYLHPLANGYLLGVGQQVNPQAVPENGEQPLSTPVEEGMKVSLFDVSDSAAPIEVNTIVKANSYTPVEWDYRALSVLQQQSQYQFALPIEQWQTSSDPNIKLWQPRNALLMLDVDTDAGSMHELTQLEAKVDKDTYIYGGDDRSVIHGEHVYYIHGNQVWHGLWQAESELDGPY